MKKRICKLAVLMVLVVFPTIQAQTPVLPRTYAETIRLFPEDLQSGFYGMYTVVSTTASSETALSTLHAYYLVHWMKENYIITGRGSEVGADGRTSAIIMYTQQRTALLANIGNLIPAMGRYGNPGGTNWDVWMQRLMEWM